MSSAGEVRTYHPGRPTTTVATSSRRRSCRLGVYAAGSSRSKPPSGREVTRTSQGLAPSAVATAARQRCSGSERGERTARPSQGSNSTSTRPGCWSSSLAAMRSPSAGRVPRGRRTSTGPSDPLSSVTGDERVAKATRPSRSTESTSQPSPCASASLRRSAGMWRMGSKPCGRRTVTRSVAMSWTMPGRAPKRASGPSQPAAECLHKASVAPGSGPRNAVQGPRSRCDPDHDPGFATQNRRSEG